MKIEIKITDEAGNVQQYVVSGSLPDDEAIFTESARIYPDHKDNTEQRWLDIGKYRLGFKLGAKYILEFLKGNDR